MSYLKNILIVSLLSFVIFTPTVFGAELMWSPKSQTLGVGDSALVDLSLSTGKQTINAGEGEVVVPDNLEIVDIRIGQSMINLWLESPKEISTGKVRFSGITPGGYRGESMILFSLVLKAKTAGQTSINPQAFRVLLNDGLGTVAPLTVTSAKVEVTSQTTGKSVTPLVDNVAPETFDVQVGKDQTIFDGVNFAVFITNDKGVGIDRYEIKESKSRLLSWLSKWEKAESPFRLKDQKLNSFIWVKAFDKNGNSQIVLEKPSNPLSWYVNYDIWIIIILTSIINLLIYKKWIYNRRR